MPLPRAWCPECRRFTALRKNGTFREHYYEANGKCEGSGRSPAELGAGLRREPSTWPESRNSHYATTNEKEKPDA